MVEVVSPVQNDRVVFIAEEHSGAIALASEGVRVAQVGEFVVDGGLVEECEACGLDLVEELDGDFFFFFNFWVCVLKSKFVFLLFLFKTHLDLNSYDF